MPKENELTLKDCASIVIKRKWLVIGITGLITIASAVFIYIHPTTYTATISAQISPIRVYYIEAFGKDIIINSSGIDRIFPAHLRLLKSRKILERIIQSFKTQNPKNAITVEELSRKLKITTLNSKGGELTLEAQDSNPSSAIQLVNTWAQEYQRYNKEITDFFLENISLAHNETQLIEYNQKLKELMELKAIHERLLNEIKVKITKKQNQLNTQIAMTNINIALNNVGSQISSLYRLQQQLREKIDEQRIKLGQLQLEIDASLLELISPATDKSVEEQNNSYRRTITMNDNSLPGLFSFNALARKAQPPLLPKTAVFIGVVLLCGFFAILLICLFEMYCN